MFNKIIISKKKKDFYQTATLSVMKILIEKLNILILRQLI